MPHEWLMPKMWSDHVTAAQRWRVPALIAKLLVNRGLDVDQPCEDFLSPQLKNLHPPHLLYGVTEAASMIAEAVSSKKKIVLYGDYDVDGTTGVAILWHVLHQAGGCVSFYVPHRIEEGYGLNLEAVRGLVRDGAKMIVSVDCGITAVEVADMLREAGVPLILTDHHQPHDRIPNADCIVHPTVAGRYPNPDLCGAGVAFKLAWAVAQRLSGAERVSTDYRSLLIELLSLAALGTISDVVPLRGENRIIARHGLAMLPQSTLPGVRALMDATGLSGGKISGYDVGFKLAPRINAAGRMGHARLAVELLTRADTPRAREIALYLEDHNRSRQAAERKIVKQACEMVSERGLAGDARRALVLAHEGWHAGVIGIVASRMVARYHRPTIMIALSDGNGQGSARSITGFDLVAALDTCREHLASFGGHKMAAGLRIAGERVEAFTQAFVHTANNRLTGADLTPKLRLDGEVSLDELTLPTTEAIVNLGPFGVGNPKPKFATDWVELAEEPRCVGRGSEHLQASFVQNGVRMKGIGFRMSNYFEDLKQYRRCRVAFEPIINEFNGRRTVEMHMLDLQFPRK